jgi:hypothetical protein
MISTRRVLLASLIAPLTIAAPALVFTVLVALEATASTDSPARFQVFLFGGLAGSLVVHTGLTVAYTLIALLLRKLRLLTRRAMFALGAFVSLAVASWFAHSLHDHLPISETIQGFAIQGVVWLVLLTLLSTVWWRVAMGSAAKPPAPSARSEA